MSLDNNIALQEGVDYTFDKASNTFTFLPPSYGLPLQVDYTVQTPDNWSSCLSQLGMELASGTVGQPIWSLLKQSYTSAAISYSGMAYVYAQQYELNSDATQDNHNFEVVTATQVGKYGNQAIGLPSLFNPASTLPYIVDADPTDILVDIFFNPLYKLGWSRNRLSALTSFSHYVKARQLWLSPVIDQQSPARDWLTGLSDMCNCEWVWQGGVLDLIPRGDEAMSSPYGAYAPNITPVFDLVHEEGGDILSPVEIAPQINEDAKNIVRVEYTNRANGFMIETVEAKDAAHIELFGERAGDVQAFHAIHDSATAQSVAQQRLQREMCVWNTYTFELPFSRSLIGLMDLVTLTDPDSALLRVPVRITGREELDGYKFRYTAEDAPIGHASSPVYGTQATEGFAHDYNAAPGLVNAPVFFEPPVDMTSTGLEVWIAVTGTDNFWGGCTVWVSNDGTQYKPMAVAHGGARYGSLTSAMSAAPAAGDTVGISLVGQGGQLLSGTAKDAASGATLCWAGRPTGGEFFSYQGASLSTTNHYQLATLTRGAHGSAVQALASSSQFVRVDKAIIKSEPLDISMVGKTLYFKFTSLNSYGGGEQSIADVPAYPYTITGNMLNLPPSNVVNLRTQFEDFGVRVYWDTIADPDLAMYELRLGSSSWEGATPITKLKGNNYLWAAQKAGTYTLWVKAIDAYGNYSATAASAQVLVNAPAAVSANAQFVAENYVLTWQPSSSTFKIGRYRIRRGDTFASAQIVAEPQSTRFEAKVDWLGTQHYWISAIDIAENEGAAMLVEIFETPPAVAANFKASVENNHIYFYWNKPASTLPLTQIELRVGSTYASSSLIGYKPGDHTFTPHFELSAGTRIYWLRYQNSAGDWGQPISLQVTCGAPPDFILRDHRDSTFVSGTDNMGVTNNVGMVNLQWLGGKLVAPLAARTWGNAYHDAGYASPQAKIDAGYPVFLMPAAGTASYQEVLDYQVVMGSTTITIEQQTTPLTGTVNISYQLAYKAALNDAWTLAPLGQTSVLATNFRFVRYTVIYTAADDKSLVQIDRLTYRLTLQNRRDNGTANVNAADTSGTRVYFNYPFIAINSMQISVNSANAVSKCWSVQAGANPTYMDVQVFDKNGALLSCPCNWSAEGY